MKKYIPVDFDEKGNVILGRERNTPTSNGFIPTTWTPGGGGGDEGKNGIKSISISPAIETTPALDSILPLDYDTLIAEGYEPDEDGGITVQLHFASDDGLYTITTTPTNEWYADNKETGELAAQGEPVTYSIELAKGEMVAQAYDTNDFEPPLKFITVQISDK